LSASLYIKLPEGYEREMKNLLFISLLFSSLAWSETEYSVPVSEELAPYATFKIKNYEIKKANGVLTVSYDLPQELVGKKGLTISLKGKFSSEAETITLHGPKGEADCTVPEKNVLVCAIEMKDLAINSVSVTRFLTGLSTSSAEFEARQKVAEQFLGEPAGIITYRDYLDLR
jgi:hypothetical protein